MSDILPLTLTHRMRRPNAARNSDVQSLNGYAPRLVRPSAERRLSATLVMSDPASQRLLSALADGASEFRLSAADGSLMIRLRVAISSAHASEEHVKDGVFIDWSRSTVCNGPNRVRLSRTELRLLETLLRANGATIPRLQLIEQVWAGSALRRSERENALTVYICTLRKRLRGIGLNSALQTVRRTGYRLTF
jgi:DNA-binding response OmpR family regulator